MLSISRIKGLVLSAALIAAAANVAVAQSQAPTGQPAASPAVTPGPRIMPGNGPRVQSSRPASPRQPVFINPRNLQPAPSATPTSSAPARGQPQNIQPASGPSIQPGAVPAGTSAPSVRPLNIQGQRAPTPFWWGPTAGGAQPGRRNGSPIPGAYSPMGRPAVLTQPEYYPAPGHPRRYQKEIAYGPLPPPGPNLPDDGLGPIRPITDPHPTVPPSTGGGGGGGGGHGHWHGNGNGDGHFGRGDRGDGFNRNVVVHGGSGVLINGRVEGDNFRLAFTSGGSPFQIDRFGFARDCGRCYRYNRHCDFFHGGYPVYFGYDSGYYAPIYGELVTIDPAYIDPMLAQPQVAPMPQVDESTLPMIERGHLALEDDRVGDAVSYYKQHLSEHENDTDAMRWLAVALLASGESTSGSAMMMLAYQTDPSLAVSPLIASRFPDGEDGLRRRFGAAVNFAHSAKGSSAYFTAAVLAQAQGKPDVARRMLDLAKAAGLDRPVAASLEAALRK